MNQATEKIIVLLGCLLLTLSSFADESGRYFHEGDGKISFSSARTNKKMEIVYRNEDGAYNEAALRKIDAFFGLPTHFGEHVSLRLVSMLDYLEDKYAPRTPLKLLSGYRSPKHNAHLRKLGRPAAKTSYHMEAMAADVIFNGVPAEKIWKAVKKLNGGGIGTYGGQSVHVDSGRPRFWTAETALSKMDAPNKNIYLSIDKDIYRPGEKMRLFFSGISNYPFGVKTNFALKKGNHAFHTFTPEFQKTQKTQTVPSDCFMVRARKNARFIYWILPQDLGAKRNLAVEVSFCGPHYPKMPKKIISRRFEVR